MSEIITTSNVRNNYNKPMFNLFVFLFTEKNRIKTLFKKLQRLFPNNHEKMKCFSYHQSVS